jgi:hypothetical protein
MMQTPMDPSVSVVEAGRREDFLMEMYKQMWTNINRHILVVWQSVSVLLGTLAAFALVEKNIISLDVACSLVLIISAWLVAHTIDANYWFNRNLAIISNIERQFLRPNDLCLIHSYFNAHRKGGPLLDHLAVQALLGGTFSILVLAYHFIERVLPGIGAPLTDFKPVRALPYAIVIVFVPLLWRWHRNATQKYDAFRQESPGLKIGEPSNCGLHAEHATQDNLLPRK